MTVPSEQARDAEDARPPPAGARVFVSYSRKDLAIVDRLEADLQARGVQPLIDRTDIYAFEDWWKRIQGLIEQADTIVFALSPDAVASEVCAKEIAYAASLNKRFAPVVVRPVDPASVPAELGRLNFVFLDREDGREAALERLVEALGTDIGWVRTHSELGAAAERWDEAGRPAARLLRGHALSEAERWIASRPANAPLPTPETRDFVLGSRRAASRRRQLASAALAVGLVIALALAAIAQWQRTEAVAQREIARQQTALAERELAAAKRAVEGIIFDLGEGLRDVAGIRADTVRRILGTAQKTVDDLAATAPDDLDLKRSRAAMLAGFVTTYLRVADTEAALAAGREAVRVARELRAALPGDGDARQVLAMSLMRYANATLRARDRDATLASLTEGVELSRGLIAAGLEVPEATGDLIVGLELAGHLRQQDGQVDEAFRLYEEALGLSRDLVQRNPDDRAARRGLGRQLDFLGDLELDRSRVDRALVYFDEGLALRRRLVAEDESDRAASRDLSLALERIGRAALSKGEHARARTAYAEALSLRRAHAKEDPTSIEGRRDLFVTISHIADLDAVTGEPDQARLEYGEAMALARTIALLDPGSVRAQRDVLAIASKYGTSLVAAGDLPEAETVFAEALPIARQLAAQHPDEPEMQTDLARALEGAAGIKLARKDPRGALPLLEEAATVVRTVLNRRQTVQARRQMLQVLVSLGNARFATGNRAEARTAFDEALVLARALLAEGETDQVNVFGFISASLAGYQADPDPAERLRELRALLERLDTAGTLPAPARNILDKLRAMPGTGP